MATSSLGRLTLDLIAKTGGFESGMDKAARHSQRRTREMQRQWDTVRGMILKVGAALGVAFSVRQFQQIISRNASLIDSLAKTADAMGVPIERMQTLRTAGELAGVGSEQLTTSLQRMQRALGDAARGGTGASKALETLGVNLKDIVNLSPDRQLEAIAKAFAGVENEAVRASLAQELFGRSGSDMLNLIRSLEKDGLQPLQRELEQLGFLLDREGAARVEQMNDSLTVLGKFSQGVGQQMTVALAPAIQAVAWALTDAAKESGGFQNEFEVAADRIIRAVAFIYDAIVGVQRVFQIAGRGIAVVALQIELRMAKLADSIFNGPVNAINTLINLLNRIPGLEVGSVGPISQRAAADVALLQRAIAEAQRDIQEIALQPLPGSGLIERFNEARAQAERAGREIGERLNRGISLGLNEGDSAAGASAAVKKVVNEIDRELDRLIASGQRVYEQTRTPAEQLAIRIGELNDLLDVGAISWDTYARAIFQAQETFDAAQKRTSEGLDKMSKDTKKATDKMSEFSVQAARNMQSAFANFLFDPFSRGVRGMLQDFLQVLQRMAAEAAAAKIFGALGGVFGGTKTSGIGGLIGGAVKKLFGGFFAGGGVTQPGRAYVVGERGPELFVPGQTGTVVPNHQMGGGANVRIINVIDPSLVSDYLNSPGGDQTIINVLQRNSGTVRQILA